MSLVFPTTIQTPDYPFKPKREDTSIASTFEDGSVQARTKFTRSRRTFTVTWNKLSQDQFVILDDFITNQAKFKANSFTWINPATNESIEVYCDEYQEPSLTEINYYNITLVLKEV